MIFSFQRGQDHGTSSRVVLSSKSRASVVDLVHGEGRFKTGRAFLFSRGKGRRNAAPKRG